ncbi:MAG: DUF1289 domain-containing protein [Alphaproteobacteria bacterium]|nr:DUF1289 domain-containing protein [Alphaproteobacteria bacterium]MCY4319666.1 DUF1289 domain-containing protein [Alphaproteobacteria bacterium]
MTAPRPIASPCVRVCRISTETQHCEGCGRRLSEIARWARMAEAERAAIMAELPHRLAASRRLTR